MPWNKSNLTRRTVLGTACAATAMLAMPAAALTTGQATDLINKVVGELLQVVRTSNSQAQALAQFERAFVRYADVDVIARSVLGPPWRTASPAQQAAFETAFRGYLARKYGKQFREFKDAQIQISKATDHGDKGVVVSSVVTYGNVAPFNVEFQVSDRSGSPKMVNVLIERVSLLSTERSEIRAILEQQRGSIDGLIADLKRRG